MIYKSLYFYNPTVFASMFRAHPDFFSDNVLRIYLPYRAFCDSSVTQFFDKLECEKIAILPYINKCKTQDDFINKFDAVCETADGFLVENIGDLPFLDRLLTANGTGAVKILCGDYSLNVYNTESAAFWAASGLSSITVSPEPETADQIRLANNICQLSDNKMLPEVIAGGKIIVMRSEHCFITDDPKYHCGKCGKSGIEQYSLTDNAGNTFPLIGLPLDCQNLVLSAKNIEIDPEYAKKCISGDCILRYNILNDHR